MNNPSPIVDILSITDEVFSFCDSPSGSSSSEPQDEATDIPTNLNGQPYIQKISHMSSNKPHYYMLMQEQDRFQSEKGDDFVFGTLPNTADLAKMDSVSPLPYLEQSYSPSATSQQLSMPMFQSMPNDTSGTRVFQSALSVTSDSSAATSPTPCTGFNKPINQATCPALPPTIPNTSRNFADCISTYPSFSDLSSFHQAQPLAAGASSNASAASATVPLNTFKPGGLQAPDMDNSNSNMQIRVLGIPQSGAKSRVETQIKLCIQLVTDRGDKVQWWSHLKLSQHLVARDKLKRQHDMIAGPSAVRDGANGLDSNSLPIQPEKLLFLSARVICASDPSRKVLTCLGCIQRERKRSQRRKENRVKTESDDEQRQNEDEKSLALEEQKVLLFNCPEILDFSSGDTILPTRITCYCRHHNEKLGFCIYFEMHDQTGRRVATGISPPIMITDDHKTSKMKTGRKRLRTEMETSNSHTVIIPDSVTELLQQQLSQLPPVTPVRSPTQNITQTEISYRNNDLSQSQVNPSLSQQGQTSPTPQRAEQPQIKRLIPANGPTCGGIEVTVLGTGFRPGLTCMFGDTPASQTHYWSSNTLVCILPPAVEPGPVVVSIKDHFVVIDSQDVTVFTYYNENERALMELALQVVGLKMTGKVEDAREIAMRIVRGGNESQQVSRQLAANDGSQKRQLDLEKRILQVLGLMGIFGNVSPHDMSVKNAQKHTLLHLAAMLGFAKLVYALLDLECDIDAVDGHGYTALHYASWYGHERTVRILLDEGNANQSIPNSDNVRAIQLAKDSATRNAFQDYLYFGHQDDISFIQYFEDDDYLSSSDEILDAEPVNKHEARILSSDEEDNGISASKSSWMQRTLSHFQQQKEQWANARASTDTSFIQHLKNSMPSKAADLSLKALADHLLQLPRPAAVIANMSVFFSSESGIAQPFGNDGTHKNTSTEAPEQTLAWYMALAYAMGVCNGGGDIDVPFSRSDRKKQRIPMYTHGTPVQCTTLSSSESKSPLEHSSYDDHDSKEVKAMLDRKRGDITLFTVWVPLLCLALIWLVFQCVAWIANAPSSKLRIV